MNTLEATMLLIHLIKQRFFHHQWRSWHSNHSSDLITAVYWSQSTIRHAIFSVTCIPVVVSKRPSTRSFSYYSLSHQLGITHYKAVGATYPGYWKVIDDPNQHDDTSNITNLACKEFTDSVQYGPGYLYKLVGAHYVTCPFSSESLASYLSFCHTWLPAPWYSHILFLSKATATTLFYHFPKKYCMSMA